MALGKLKINRWNMILDMYWVYSDSDGTGKSLGTTRINLSVKYLANFAKTVAGLLG